MTKTLLTLAGLFVIGFSSPASLKFTPHRISAIDLYQMAANMEAESRGEPDSCTCMVGEVLENRAKHQGKTIAKSSLIGLKRKPPSERSLTLARKVLQGNHSHNYRYFINPDLATDMDWIFKNQNKKKIRCGKHLFW